MLRLRIALFVFLAVALISCKKEAPPAAAKPGPLYRNLLLITIDTVRADALSVYGGKTPVPFLESFARNGAVFDHAFTSAPITLPAHTSLMSGLYPPSHGVRNNGTFRAPDSLHLLAEYARRNGMSTGAVIGGYPLASQFGLNQGFDFYDDSFPRRLSAPGVYLYAEKDAEQVRQSAQSWLGHAKPPYFLWLHFFDPHHPYLEHGFTGLEPYQQEIAYVDQQLGLFFEFLKARRMEDGTLVVICSDHGEAFGEHGEVSHTLFVYNTTLHVPLMMAGAGIPAGRRPELVRLVDVLPSVLEAFGWKPEAAMDGASLWPLIHGNAESPRQNYAETFAPAYDFGWSPLASLQDLRYKYIRAPRPEFYDLQADPGENHSLSADTSQSYRKEIDALLAGPARTGAAHEPSPEERERLASLGYISGGRKHVDWSGPDPKDRVEVAKRIAELAAAPLPSEDKARAYAAIAATEPANSLLQLRYAEVLLTLKKYREAQQVFQHVLDLEYPSADAYNGMATALFYQNQSDAALLILRQAVQVGLADGETHYNLGEFYFSRGDRTGAMQQYDRSMAMDYAPAFYRKARLLDLMVQPDQALQVLRAAESKFPSDMQANFDLGMILFRRRDFAGSVAEFEKALKKAPDEKSIYYNLGVAYLRMGNAASARENLERFLREAPPGMEQQRTDARALLKQLSSH